MRWNCALFYLQDFKLKNPPQKFGELETAFSHQKSSTEPLRSDSSSYGIYIYLIRISLDTRIDMKLYYRERKSEK